MRVLLDVVVGAGAADGTRFHVQTWFVPLRRPHERRDPLERLGPRHRRPQGNSRKVSVLRGVFDVGESTFRMASRMASHEYIVETSQSVHAVDRLLCDCLVYLRVLE